MKVVADVGRMNVESLGATHVARSPSGCQLCLNLTKGARRWNRIARAKCCKIAQTKVDTNLAGNCRLILDLNLEADPPTPQGVFSEAPAFGASWYGSALRPEKSEAVPAICNAVSFYPSRLRLKRNPSTSTLDAEAGAESQRSAAHPLLTYSLYGLLVDTQLRANTFAFGGKIKMRKPSAWFSASPITGERVEMLGNAPIPYLIAGRCVLAKDFLGRAVFDPVFIGPDR